jgi:hypothetical protein
MLMPPESKQTPLPTIARWRSSASRSLPHRAHEDHPRRVVTSRARPRGHPHPELAAPVGLDHVDPQPCFSRPGLSARTSRAESFATVRQRLRVVRALADDHAALGAPSGAAFPRRGDEDQLVEEGGAVATASVA